MNSWFTVERIDARTFAISEYRHREETHCYLLCGREKAVLIDTGLGVSDIRQVTDSLTALPKQPVRSPRQPKKLLWMLPSRLRRSSRLPVNLLRNMPMNRLASRT